MKKLVVCLIFALLTIYASQAQIILHPQCTGTTSYTICMQTFIETYTNVIQPAIWACRGHEFWGGQSCQSIFTNASGVIEFNIEHTAYGGDFPTSNMTAFNWTAHLNGLRVIEVSGRGRSINACLFNLQENQEDGLITVGDMDAWDRIIQTLFLTVPETGSVINGIDITGALRHDLFYEPDSVSTGFVIRSTRYSHPHPPVKIRFDPSEFEIIVHRPGTGTPVFTTTPTPSTTPAPTQTATPTPGNIPTPKPTTTPTPAVTHTSTATPSNKPLGIELILPSNLLYPYSEFRLSAQLNNPGIPITGIPLFVILDIDGRLFFLPEFVEYPSIDYLSVNVGHGSQTIEIIPPFLWPEAAGSKSGVYFHAAMVHPSLNWIIGEPDTVEFGWTEASATQASR